MKRGNALDWFHEEYCRRCDLPNDKCEAGSPKEIACLLANILKKQR